MYYFLYGVYINSWIHMIHYGNGVEYKFQANEFRGIRQPLKPKSRDPIFIRNRGECANEHYMPE